ncbi:bis(5'-nucleosyl)-tetraphosphatase [asymmetrical]-like [Gigantopelta aegis]|uniref:bis(5'-nucleosyl)-tetraphosphatase [asymmetrical]-like n=1 Tax=Gigantopelta aegis TaxID=1735272 RepID=UPI001B88BC10|nr:bis(5'-nucleosyl)-tetraphosphatase [asymmetrical]-like [Gigantopelta aegis]
MSTELHVRAAGFVLYRRVHGHVEYLLLQAQSRKRHWTLPKGRVDPGEEELETAFRETREESGITSHQVDLIEDFRREIHYTVHGNRNKRVIYWLAELKDPETAVTLSDEHIAFRWCTIDDVMDLIHIYPVLQKLMKEADEFIHSSK